MNQNWCLDQDMADNFLFDCYMITQKPFFTINYFINIQQYLC